MRNNNPSDNRLFFNLFIDCESTQPAIGDAALGEKSARGFAETLESRQLQGTFHVLCSDLEASPKLYRELHTRGHDIGLHVHPIMHGMSEFLGVHGGEEQYELLSSLCDRFSQVMGFRPTTWCPGYFSTNDATYQAAYDIGLRSGCTSIPGRAMPECASVHVGAPLDPHYAHPYNRLLAGGLDYVELPITVDPESRVWGGKQAQDLRIEFVDAKNHWYTMKKSVDRQVRERTPLVYLRGFTHNLFDFSDPCEFRRQTLEGVIERAQRIAESHGLQIAGATAEQIGAVYREKAPRGEGSQALALDRSGY